MLEGTSGDRLVQPSAPAGTPIEEPSATSRQLWKSPSWKSSLGNLCHCFINPHSKKVLPGIQNKHPVFHFVPTASCPGTGHHKSSIICVLLSGVYRHLQDSPKLSPLQAKQSQVSQTFPIEEVFQVFTILVVLCWTLSSMSGSLVLEGPEVGTALQMQPF